MKTQRKRKRETWEEAQRRLVAETSVYLTLYLEHPEEAISIPAIPAGSGRFPKSFCGVFWRQVLFE